MVDLFLNWIGNTSLGVSDDIVYVFVVVASLMILNFILDFFRYIMYYIAKR